MAYVKFGSVRPFPGAVPDKGQAVKPLEEVMRETESLADQVADMAIGGER